MKKSGKKTYNTFERVLIFLFTFTFLVSASMLGIFLWQYNKGSSTYKTIEKEYVQQASTSAGEGQLMVEFQALAEINPDIVAWIYIPGTKINYPVVQGSDNDYYLKHLFNGQSNKAGSIFADAYNADVFQDANTVIYGHNMADKTMFSVLVDYKSQDFYSQHPFVYIFTPGQNYKVEIFSAYVANLQMDTWEKGFQDADAQQLWLQNALARSSIKSNIQPSLQDNFVTLSTCTYEFEDARYIVVGRLVLV